MAIDNILNGQNTGQPDWLPAKFWDAQNGKPRVEELARSYGELERSMGSAGGVNNLKSHADYKINPGDVLELDDEINKRMFERGFNNDQAQFVYDLGHEHLMPLMQQFSQEHEDQKQQSELVEHFGSVDRFNSVRPQIRAWGEANLGADVYATLSGSVEGVIAIHEMMKNREPGLDPNSKGSTSVNAADLKNLMSDPKYWRDRDPALVSRVRSGFQALYPDQQA